LTIFAWFRIPAVDVYQNRFLENWQQVSMIRKPVIAAVSGYAVNAGRFHLSNPSALTLQRYRFPLIARWWLRARPDGRYIPGSTKRAIRAAGSEHRYDRGRGRIARAVGKSWAMELTLTGRMWDAREAAEWGMASRVVGEGEARPVRSSWRLRGRARLPCRRRRRSSMLARPLVFFFPVWSWFYTALILYVLVCVRAWWFSV